MKTPSRHVVIGQRPLCFAWQGGRSGARPLLSNLTARQFIRETDFASLFPLKALSPTALPQLQGVDRKTRKRQERAGFESWIASSIQTVR